MNKIYLSIVGFFNPVLERAGVNTEQLHEILKIKFLIDARRPRQAFGNRGRINYDTKKVNTPIAVSLGTVILGVMLALMLVFFKAAMIGQIIYFSMFMILLAMTLISDFTSVLFDTKDQYIILPRPVDERTLSISRILHISLYVTRLALLQGLPGLIFIGFIDGLAALPLFLIQVIEATFLTVVIVNIVYLLLMRSVSPQRFKDIISYFQIAFSIVIFAVYYLLPRLINISMLRGFVMTDHQWVYYIPPAWIAALNEVLIHPGRSNIVTSGMAIAGITLPVIGMWLVAKVLAPGFNRRLALISTSDAPVKPVSAKSEKKDWRDKIADALAPDPVENAGFKITWKLAARLREFKMKVYPSFAFIPIYFIYFMFNGKGEDLNEKFNNMRHGRSYILLIYMATFVLSAVLQHISYTEKYKAAWVYYTSPVSQPGKILSGMFKAVITFYYLPYCLVLGIVMAAIWGPQVINDLILAFFVAQIYAILMALFMVKGLPFSNPVSNARGGGRVFVSLVITAFIGVAGFGHYFLMRWEMVIWILIVPAVLIYLLMLRYYKKQSWDNIAMVDL